MAARISQTEFEPQAELAAFTDIRGLDPATAPDGLSGQAVHLIFAGLVVLLFRQKHTLDADAWRELKG